MAEKKRNYRSDRFKREKRALREGAFILYFESLFRDDSIDDIFDAACEYDDEENVNISVESLELAKKVQEKSAEIDEIISEFSKKRSVGRISKLNLAILRLAVYEAKFEKKVPVNVAISEAVLLARKYTYDPDVAFINGVLGAYSREYAGEGTNE